MWPASRAGSQEAEKPGYAVLPVVGLWRGSIAPLLAPRCLVNANRRVAGDRYSASRESLVVLLSPFC